MMLPAPPARTGAPLRVGLTGGIACGKSTVASLFAEIGVPVIDLDVIARQVVEPGSPGLMAVVAGFGDGVLGLDGRLDRTRLRAQVFDDPAARKKLEAILHPRILAEAVRQCEGAGGPYQVVVVPLLVESGLTGWVDRVLVVDCLPEIQMARLAGRDGTTEDQARAMLAAQASREARLAVADDVIDNAGAPDALPEAVNRLDAAYREMAAGVRGRDPGLRLP
jgi:dephospho-CoA kinase